jgi:hypothetical protein
MRSLQQLDAIMRSKWLKKLGIREGNRRVYWVSYTENGEPAREYYLSPWQALERANELIKQGIKV